MSIIIDIHAREILDSRGNPTVEVDVTLEESKEEAVVDTAPESTEQEVVTEIKETEKKEDEKLEDYSKGVQARIAKLTRKMREAERKEAEQESNSESSVSLNTSSKIPLLKQLVLQSILQFLLNEAFAIM